jgi:hypothetical protein
LSVSFIEGLPRSRAECGVKTSGPKNLWTKSGSASFACHYAASRVIGEVRRCHGPRAAAKVLPSIYARAGIIIEPAEYPQGELALTEKPEPTKDES